MLRSIRRVFGYTLNVCVNTSEHVEISAPSGHGWYTEIVALVNATSVISAVQLALGHPACAGVGCAGAPVVTLKDS